jgi:hypothetical protein
LRDGTYSREERGDSDEARDSNYLNFASQIFVELEHFGKVRMAPAPIHIFQLATVTEIK